MNLVEGVQHRAAIMLETQWEERGLRPVQARPRNPRQLVRRRIRPCRSQSRPQDRRVGPHRARLLPVADQFYYLAALLVYRWRPMPGNPSIAQRLQCLTRCIQGVKPSLCPLVYSKERVGHTVLARWLVGTSPSLFNVEVPIWIAVGTALAGGPPHRSQRALLAHWAPASGSNVEAHAGEGMLHAGRW